MIYILAIASPTFNVDKDVYDYFDKPKADYGDIKDIVYSHCGSLFTYQYSHAFFDFRNKVDKNGIDWFENSVKATLANRQYCIDNMNKYKTFGENAWGLTACLTPEGYKAGIGSKPCSSNLEVENDGTVVSAGCTGKHAFRCLRRHCRLRACRRNMRGRQRADERSPRQIRKETLISESQRTIPGRQPAFLLSH